MSENDAMDDERPASITARVVTIVIGVLLAGFVVVLATGGDDDGGADPTPLLGRAVPELVGTTLSGDTFDIDDYQGTWVLLNFFASWCIPCENEHPELVEFARRHADGSAAVVSVNNGEGERAAREFFEEHGGDWPVIYDADSASARFVVLQVPESFLIDPLGRVVWKWNGEITADRVDSVMDALLEPA